MKKTTKNREPVRTIAKNLEPVTFDVLKNASTLANPICFSVSELVLADIFRKFEYFDAPTTPLAGDLVYAISPVPQLQTKAAVKFNASENLIVLNEVPFQIVVSDKSFRRIASKTFFISVRTKPSIGATTLNSFDLIFQGAEISSQEEPQIVKPDVILANYPTLEAFISVLQSLAEDLVNARAAFEFFLPSVISSIPLPEYWNQVQGYQLNFDKFVYRDVFNDEAGVVGYLFLVFGVTSLNLPNGCFCPEDNPPAARKIKKRDIQLPVPPDEFVMSIGISQNAFYEIVAPQLFNSGTKVIRRGGTVYGYVSGWVKTEPSEILIQDDSLKVAVLAAAGGAMKVGVKAKCSRNIEFGYEARITFQQIAATVKFQVEEAPEDGDFGVTSQTLTMDFLPEIGEIIVDFDTFDPLVEEVASGLATLLLNSLKDLINAIMKVENSAGLLSTSTNLDQTSVGFKLVEGYPVYRKEEAFVLLVVPDFPRLGIAQRRKNKTTKGTVKRPSKSGKTSKKPKSGKASKVKSKPGGLSKRGKTSKSRTVARKKGRNG
jgi:hypothetical protein